MTSTVNETVSFVAFWKALKETMKDRGQPEVLFRDARLLWDVAVDQARIDRDQALGRRIKKLAA